MSMIYDTGDRVRIAALFRNQFEQLTDPTEVMVTIKAPSVQSPSENTLTEYRYSLSEVIRGSVGHFYVDVDLNASGVWRFRWTATGDLIAAQEGQLTVRRSHVV